MSESDVSNNYIKISKEHWHTLQAGTHIKYSFTDDRGKVQYRGGIIALNPFDTTTKYSDGKIIRFFKLKNKFNKQDESNYKYAEWLKAYDSIDEICIRKNLELERADQLAKFQKKQGDLFKDKIDVLTKELKSLRKEIEKLKNTK